MLFDKFENKQVITGVITAIDPIHIGASKKDSLDPTQVDSSVLKDADDKPIIPGSSLKGVIRSNFAAALKSADLKACNVISDSCMTNERLNQIKESAISDESKAEQIYEESCEVCRLFGGKGIASRISFKDCSFIGDKCIYEHRDGTPLNPDTGVAVNKFDFEIVPKGARFNFYMTAENLDETQEKYLEFILKLLKSGEISVGGMTTRGLGRIQLSDVTVKKTDKEDLRMLLGL